MGPGVLEVYGPDLPETSGGPRAILFLEFIMELSASRNLTGKSGGASHPPCVSVLYSISPFVQQYALPGEDDPTCLDKHLFSKAHWLKEAGTSQYDSDSGTLLLTKIWNPNADQQKDISKQLHWLDLV